MTIKITYTNGCTQYKTINIWPMDFNTLIKQLDHNPEVKSYDY